MKKRQIIIHNFQFIIFLTELVEKEDKHVNPVNPV